MPHTDQAWGASRLRELVQERGLKHKWLAEQLGVDPTTFSRWMKGRNVPSLAHGVKLARLLGVPVSDLVVI